MPKLNQVGSPRPPIARFALVGDLFGRCERTSLASRRSGTKSGEAGAVPLLILLAGIGIISVLAVVGFAPFRNNLFSSLFPKDSIFAASPYNPGDTDGDLDVDIFDYNVLLTNFGQAFNNADFDGNGRVDIFDFNALLSNFGKNILPTPHLHPLQPHRPAPHPEFPGTLVA